MTAQVTLPRSASADAFSCDVPSSIRERADGNVDTVATLLDALRQVASSRAYLDAVEMTVTELLTAHVQNVAVTRLAVRRPDAGPAAVAAERVEARAALADELALTTGSPVGAQRDLVEFAAAPASRTGTLRALLAEGVAGWSRIRAVWRDTAELSDAVVQGVAASVFAPGPGGGVASHQLFRRRLNRLVTRHTGGECRRRQTRDRRDCSLDTWPDGAATLSLTGPIESLVGAFERVDSLARTLRSGGDDRTLAQLRFDVGAGLLCHGQPTRRAQTPTESAGARDGGGDGGGGGGGDDCGDGDGGGSGGRGGRGEGGGGGVDVAAAQATAFATGFAMAFPEVPLPVASITVVVSAASLLGVSDDPGEVPNHGFLPAQTVRDLAHELGSTWRRLVTDPLTGYAMAGVSPSYRPPPRMARAVRDRDGTCRFPGCTHAPARSDLDHVIPHPTGPTSGENLQTLHRRHHQRKTRALWGAHMDADGVVTWTTPLGRVHSTVPFDYRTEFGEGGEGGQVGRTGGGSVLVDPGTGTAAPPSWTRPHPGPPPFSNGPPASWARPHPGPPPF